MSWLSDTLPKVFAWTWNFSWTGFNAKLDKGKDIRVDSQRAGQGHLEAQEGVQDSAKGDGKND